jgi:hypothetical protein
MVGRSIQLLSHEVLTSSKNSFGTVWKSQIIPYSGETGWYLIIQNDSAITGTSPGIIWELDVSDNGGTYTRVGGAVATFSAVGALVIPYILNSTQGVAAAGTSGHVYLMQVVGTLGNADNVVGGVSVDLIATV